MTLSYKTDELGYNFFLSCTGICFEGNYPGKTSKIGEVAIEVMKPEWVRETMSNKIFVFGSNLAGRHDSGSAYYAMKIHGAEYGKGVGRTGNAYAIPTKGLRLEVLPLDEIQYYVSDFILYAKDNPSLTFDLVKVGCGLAGYTSAQMAPMFKGIPENVIVPKEWVSVYQGGLRCT